MPLFINKQFRAEKSEEVDDNDDNTLYEEEVRAKPKKELFDYVPRPELFPPKLERHPDMKNFELGKFRNRVYPNSVIKCFTMVQREGVCHRVNNLATYMIANREMSKLGKEFGMHDKDTTLVSKTIRGVSDSILSDNIVLGDRVTITNSVIGPNSQIGTKSPGQKNPVKIINSVIMDHVTIEDGVTITDSIVCPNATVAQGAQLTNCIVGKSFTTDGKTNFVFILTIYSFRIFFSLYSKIIE